MRRLRCANPQGHYSTYTHKLYREGEEVQVDEDFPDFHFDELDATGQVIKEAACRKSMETEATFGGGVKKLPPATVKKIELLCLQKAYPVDDILSTYELKDLAFLPKQKALELIRLLDRMKDAAVEPAPDAPPAEPAPAQKKP
jgi:hypothetical protein